MREAEVRGVSVIMVHSSTWEVVQRVDEIFGQLKLKTKQQIDCLKQTICGQPWMDNLGKTLGLTP
jgi:BioD-like phosphotransacetylase family protein